MSFRVMFWIKRCNFLKTYCTRARKRKCAMAKWLVLWALERTVRVQAMAGTLRCVLGKDTSLSYCPGRGFSPYMGYIGMCSPKGYGFSGILVINKVSILAILPPFKCQVINRVLDIWSQIKNSQVLVINRVGKIVEFGHKKGEGFGKLAAHPHPIFWEYSPGILPLYLFTQVLSG